MKYYLTFVKLPFVYCVVSAGNAAQAIKPFQKYRNDVVANGNELRFTFGEAVDLHNKWEEVSIDYIKGNANTKKKYKITCASSGVVRYVEAIKEDLDTELIKENPGSQFVTILNERFLIKKVKKETIPLYNIKEVSKFPKEVPLLKENNDKTLGT